MDYDAQIALRNAVPLSYDCNQPFLVVNNNVLLFFIKSRWLLSGVVALHSKKTCHYDAQSELRNAVPLSYDRNQQFLVVNNVVLLFSIESRWLLCDVVALYRKNFGITTPKIYCVMKSLYLTTIPIFVVKQRCNSSIESWWLLYKKSRWKSVKIWYFYSLFMIKM